MAKSGVCQKVEGKPDDTVEKDEGTKDRKDVDGWLADLNSCFSL